MTTNTVAEHTEHLADDELLRFIDGEEDDMRAAWEAHVRVCARCAAEADLLRGHSVLVHDWLERAAFEQAFPAREPTAAPAAAPDVVPIDAARHRRARWTRVSPWMRAAALVLLATPVAAIPSVRHWIADTYADIRGTGVQPAPATVQQELQPAAVGAIRFVPAAGTFTVLIDAWQHDGTITVQHVAGYEAVLQASAPGIEPVVSATTLRLRNDGVRNASYTLQLPPTVERVVVTIEGRSGISIDAAGLRAGTGVSLRQ